MKGKIEGENETSIRRKKAKKKLKWENNKVWLLQSRSSSFIAFHK